MLKQIAREDGPVLAACTSLFSYCSFVNVASIAQQIGMIAAGITAVIVLVHRLYKIFDGESE